MKIAVREYYKYEDIIAAKLTTTFNGEQLITGGMLHISAEQDGKPVTIDAEKTPSLYFIWMLQFVNIKK